MEYVWVINWYYDEAPLVRRYVLVQKNQKSVTVKKNGGTKVIKKAAYRDFVFTEEEAFFKIKQLCQKAMETLEAKQAKVEALLVNPRYYEVPHERANGKKNILD